MHQAECRWQEETPHTLRYWWDSTAPHRQTCKPDPIGSSGCLWFEGNHARERIPKSDKKDAASKGAWGVGIANTTLWDTSLVTQAGGSQPPPSTHKGVCSGQQATRRWCTRRPGVPRPPWWGRGEHPVGYGGGPFLTERDKRGVKVAVGPSAVLTHLPTSAVRRMGVLCVGARLARPSATGSPILGRGR